MGIASQLRRLTLLKIIQLHHSMSCRKPASSACCRGIYFGAGLGFFWSVVSHAEFASLPINLGGTTTGWQLEHGEVDDGSSSNRLGIWAKPL